VGPAVAIATRVAPVWRSLWDDPEPRLDQTEGAATGFI
jgi:hypothetical protein